MHLIVVTRGDFWQWPVDRCVDVGSLSEQNRNPYPKTSSSLYDVHVASDINGKVNRTIIYPSYGRERDRTVTLFMQGIPPNLY